MSAKLYRLRVYATDGITVDFTVTSSQLSAVPTIPGPIARPLEGKTEAQPWQAEMLSSAVEGDIADADGRLDLGGRLSDWSESTDDGVTYTVLWTGRLTGLSSPDPATFRATLEDERFLERRSVIFSTNQGSVQICPPGPRSQWGRDPVRRLAGRTATMRVTEVDGTDAVHLEWKDGWTCSRGALDFVAQDAKADADGRKDQGNFTHTRLNIAGTDREVISFALSRSGHDLLGTIEDEVGGPSMWVYWPAHGLTQWDEVDACYLYAPTAPPTPDLPLLIGGSAGVTDAQLAQDIYSGDYGATDEAGNPVAIRYDATAFTALQGLATWFVVEGPENMAAWLEEHIYRPRQWVPFVNASGQVAPRSTALARDIDYTALPTLTTSNVLHPYPEWDYAARDSVTSLRFKVRRHYWRGAASPLPEDGDFPSSLVTWRTRTEERDHDNISTMGRVSRTIDFIRDAGGPRVPLLDVIAREYFERVGDGVLRIPALRTTEALEAGDFVTLDSDTLKLPNPNTNARTGDSIWQVLKVDRLPGTGYAVEMGYAGPSQQKLTAPTLSAALNASVPEHLVDVTISGLGTGEGYIMEVDRGDGAGWVPARTGFTNETITVGGCPSGTLAQFRALTTKRSRIRSAWSTTASVTTTAITAPSGFTGTVTATTVAGEWTNGDATYRVMPTLDGADVLDEALEAGSDAFVWQGLAASTAYTLGVKHIDPYGGASAITTLAKTTAAASTLTAPSGLGVVQGRAASGDVPPHSLRGASGVEFAWDNAGEGADTEWQVATDSGFTSIIRQGIAENAGARVGRAWVRTGFRRSLLYIRPRHIKDGYTASSWASSISTYSTTLRAPGGPRKTELLANTDAGALAKKDAVDLATSEVLNKVADNIAESATKKWAGESGADVTAGKSLSVLADRTLDNVTDTATRSAVDADYVDANNRPAKADTLLVNGQNAMRHQESSALGKHGVGVSFGSAYGTTPAVVLLPANNALVHKSTYTADQHLRMTADSLTTSGFTPTCEVVDNSSTATTAITDGFSSAQNTASPENGDVALSADGAVAYSNLEDANTNETQYTVFFDVDTGGMGAFNFVTVELYANDAAGSTTWTLKASKMYSSGKLLTDESISFNGALGADFDLRVRLAYNSAPGASTGTITFHGEDNVQPGVEYDKVTSSPTSEPMTTSTFGYIYWIAQEG